MKTIKDMTLDKAEKLAMKTDYACFAVGEDINTGDAAAFFLEGYNYAIEKLEFTSRDIDFSYLLGIFNTSGLEGMHKEIERVKGLNLKPCDIIRKFKI